VYFGKPGGFKWQADFKEHPHAKLFARELAKLRKTSVEDLT
jgi:hypothetical protein